MRRYFPFNLLGRKKNDIDSNNLSVTTKEYANKVKRISLTKSEEEGEASGSGHGDGKIASCHRIPIPIRFQQTFVQAASRKSISSSGGSNNNNGTSPPQSSQSQPPLPTGSIDDNVSTTKGACCDNAVVLDDKKRVSIETQQVPPSPSSRIPKPSLFLEEMAHLFSLLSAVACATLRNDNPCAELPVTEYIPGKPFPPADPDRLDKAVKIEYDHGNTLYKWFLFCFGLSRTERQRTLYNAARPFAVLGGVSDEEVRRLHDANGPYAKVSRETNRCWNKALIDFLIFNLAAAISYCGFFLKFSLLKSRSHCATCGLTNLLAVNT